MPTPTVLDAEVTKVAARIRKATKGKLNEQNTKASMIEPILRALGWDTEDVDEVAREYRSRSKDSQVHHHRPTSPRPGRWSTVANHLCDERQ